MFRPRRRFSYFWTECRLRHRPQTGPVRNFEGLHRPAVPDANARLLAEAVLVREGLLVEPDGMEAPEGPRNPEEPARARIIEVQLAAARGLRARGQPSLEQHLPSRRRPGHLRRV